MLVAMTQGLKQTNLEWVGIIATVGRSMAQALVVTPNDPSVDESTSKKPQGTMRIFRVTVLKGRLLNA